MHQIVFMAASVQCGATHLEEVTFLKVRKIDAAKSQLDTAIQLWFQDADPVSVHTLAYAAHEIIHVVSKKRGRKVGLIFDSELVKPEAKVLWAKLTKQDANFFKHAKDDFDAEIEFQPATTEYFIGMSIFGLDLCKEPKSPVMACYLSWIGLHKPELMSDEVLDFMTNRVDINIAEALKKLKKSDFFKTAITAYNAGVKSGRYPARA